MRNVIVGLVLLWTAAELISCAPSELRDESSHARPKRNYYGYDYGWGCCTSWFDNLFRGDYWYAGRIFGIILGILILLACCCIPCICLAGIWFAGWFGIKSRRDAKKKQQEVIVQQQQPQNADIVHLHSEPQPVRTVHATRYRDRSPPRSSYNAGPSEQVIYSAEDRFYTTSNSRI